MGRIRILMTLIFIIVGSYAQGQNYLTNDDIIKLSKARISKTIILTKIEMEPNKFDLSAEGIVNLKKKWVKEEIIKAMMNKNYARDNGNTSASKTNLVKQQGIVVSEEESNEKVNTATVQKNTKVVVNKPKKSTTTNSPKSNSSATTKQKITTVNNVPNKTDAKEEEETQGKNATTISVEETIEPEENSSFENSGIYFKSADDSYTVLDPTTVTGGKVGGFGQMIKSSVTMGIGKVKSKSKINGKEANYSVESNTEFYFYFDPGNSSLNNSTNEVDADNFFNTVMRQQNYTAMSPNDFKLIKLKVVGNTREVVTGTMNGYGAENGITGEKIISFKYSKVSKQLYKITFNGDLKKGQYCFYYAGNSTNQGVLGNFYSQNAIKLFDFGVQ